MVTDLVLFHMPLPNSEGVWPVASMKPTLAIVPTVPKKPASSFFSGEGPCVPPEELSELCGVAVCDVDAAGLLDFCEEGGGRCSSFLGSDCCAASSRGVGAVGSVHTS